jgi:hypothetical protein
LEMGSCWQARVPILKHGWQPHEGRAKGMTLLAVVKALACFRGVGRCSWRRRPKWERLGFVRKRALEYVLMGLGVALVTSGHKIPVYIANLATLLGTWGRGLTASFRGLLA